LRLCVFAVEFFFFASLRLRGSLFLGVLASLRLSFFSWRLGVFAVEFFSQRLHSCNT